MSGQVDDQQVALRGEARTGLQWMREPPVPCTRRSGSTAPRALEGDPADLDSIAPAFPVIGNPITLPLA